MTDKRTLTMLELFSGSGVMSKAFSNDGFETLTWDINKEYNPDVCRDIFEFDNECEYLHRKYDVIWASPPCQCFSVASIGSNWKGDYEPKTDKTKMAIQIVRKTISIIEYMKPKFWFIENPRGVLRKMSFMQGLTRKTLTYCQYGDDRMKPTDIWTNADINFKPMCKNGDDCHVSAPRGSKTGTQGLKNAYERGIIPEELCRFISHWCREEISGEK